MQPRLPSILSARPRWLAVFHAGLHVGVGSVDQCVEGCRIGRRSRLELRVAHEFAGAFEDTGGIWKCGSLKKSDVYVRGENIDVRERHISQACDGAAIVHQFADLVAAAAHYLKPVLRDGTEVGGLFLQPCVDGGIMLD
jgi:hypothetical protein